MKRTNPTADVDADAIYAEADDDETFDLIVTLKPTNSKKKGYTIMNISKLKIIAKYLTGGLASVVEYLLDTFNELIQKLPADEVAKYAQLAKDIANFVDNCCVLITNEAKKNAAKLTAQAFADLATSLLDAKLTKDELAQVVASVKNAIAAWKAA